MGGLVENVTLVREKIAAAARRSNRQPEDIILVAVTKNITVDIMQKAVEAGLSCFGENRVQELVAKQPYFTGVEWHFIGHLQRNKVRQVWDKVALIHSVDSLALARELDKRASSRGKKVRVLLEVNVAGEAGKFGIAPENTLSLLKEMAELEFIEVWGLMTIAPLVETPEVVRPVFRRLAELRRQVEKQPIPRVFMRYLSMGMTNDFEVAVEEGSNMVRIGTALFGARD